MSTSTAFSSLILIRNLKAPITYTPLSIPCRNRDVFQPIYYWQCKITSSIHVQLPNSIALSAVGRAIISGIRLTRKGHEQLAIVRVYQLTTYRSSRKHLQSYDFWVCRDFSLCLSAFSLMPRTGSTINFCSYYYSVAIYPWQMLGIFLMWCTISVRRSLPTRQWPLSSKAFSPHWSDFKATQRRFINDLLITPLAWGAHAKFVPVAPDGFFITAFWLKHHPRNS